MENAQAAGNLPLKSKKPTRHPENWRKNVTKTNKLAGLGYIQHYSMNAVPPRTRKDLACRHQCSNMLTEDEKNEIFNRFNLLNDHEKQNIYLQGCIGRNTQRNCKINCIGRTVYVCTKYFLGLHAIQYSRLRHKVLQPTVPIQDRRGKHVNHRRTSDAILNSVRQFLQNLPARESHYSISANPNRKYIESNMTIKKLYMQIVNDENYLASVENLKQWQFHKIFNYEFNIGIGFPRSDICDFCETLHCSITQARLSGNLQLLEQKQLAKRLHLEEADRFFKNMSKAKEELNNPEFGIFCFDFEKNLPYPVTNIGKEFFLRQLWLYNFTIHDLKSGESYMFLYTENFGRKGSSETISFLKYFLENVIPQEIQHLRLFSDNSSGQNKNRYMFAYLQSLCLERFASVEICLPLPGHSRMQVDADFALIEKRRQKEDKIHFPSEWVQIIRSARVNKPFHTFYGNFPVTDNLDQDGTPIVTICAFKSSLENLVLPAQGVNQVRQMKFRRGNFHPLITKSLLQECTQVYKILKDHVSPEILLNTIANAPPAYQDYLPISRKKHDNILFLLSKFYRAPGKIFYTSVFSRRSQEEIRQENLIREVMNEYPEPMDFTFLD